MNIELPVLLFVACLSGILWVLAGYPLWLACRARIAGKDVSAGAYEPLVTVILPVHNGGRFLAAKLDSVLASAYPPEKLDVVVLSDASTDDTDLIAESYVSTGRVRFLRLPRVGKASALTAGFQHSSREILLLTDVRQLFEPSCVRLLVSRFHDPAIGAVSGNLKIRSGITLAEENVGLYWRYEKWIRNSLSRLDSILGATGAIYAIRRSHARALPKECILDDVWLPFQAMLSGSRTPFVEDAVVWDYPTDLGAEFDRKVRTQAGLYQLLALEPRLLKPWSNRLWVPFVMLKLGRLFMPHMLIALFLISWWLPPTMRAIVLPIQLGFYGFGFLDHFISEGVGLKRLTSAIWAFLSLLTAAFFAQAIFFTDPTKLWKTTRVRIAPSETLAGKR